ncbi:MAG: hypothetical protein B6V02_03035, partial [Thermoprotei archaeon ex4572_64]
MDKNIKYDYEKYFRVKHGERVCVRDVLDILTEKRAICTEYAIVTVTALLYVNISPIY